MKELPHGMLAPEMGAVCSVYSVIDKLKSVPGRFSRIGGRDFAVSGAAGSMRIEAMRIDGADWPQPTGWCGHTAEIQWNRLNSLRGLGGLLDGG